MLNRSTKRNSKWIMLLATTSALLVYLAGCADLKSIRKFADTSADSASYTSLSADYPQSIERQKRYQEENYAQLDKKYQERKAQQPTLIGLHKGIEEYMHALGALASDELVSYDKSLDSFAGDIKKAKVIDDTKADAFTALTKLIAKAATDMYRQRKLQQLIEDSNKDFQIVICAMTDIVGKDFVSSLDNEGTAADKYYKEIVTVADKTPPQQAAVELVKEKWREKKEEIEARKRACGLYVETLKKIGDGHQLLFDNKDKLSSKQFLGIIDSYSKDVSSLYKKIKDLK